MSNQIPVWTANRGTMMMVRVALTQSGRTALFVGSMAELEKAVSDSNATCVVAGMAEMQAAGLTPAAMAARLGRDLSFVILTIGTTVPDAPGLRIRALKVPFSAAELRHAIETEAATPPSAQDSIATKSTDLTGMVRAEIERIVREKADAMVAEAVMKIVPELAEAMIRTELTRLMSEAGEKAISSDPAADDED